jgi:hypothetical protein
MYNCGMGLLWKRLAKRVRLIKPVRLLGCGVEEAHPCLAPSGLPLPSSFIPKTSPISSSHLSVGFATSHAFAFILNPFALLAPFLNLRAFFPRFVPHLFLYVHCCTCFSSCGILHDTVRCVLIGESRRHSCRTGLHIKFYYLLSELLSLTAITTTASSLLLVSSDQTSSAFFPCPPPSRICT